MFSVITIDNGIRKFNIMSNMYISGLRWALSAMGGRAGMEWNGIDTGCSHSRYIRIASVQGE